jgi:hypothetical protein
MGRWRRRDAPRDLRRTRHFPDQRERPTRHSPGTGTPPISAARPQAAHTLLLAYDFPRALAVPRQATLATQAI